MNKDVLNYCWTNPTDANDKIEVFALNIEDARAKIISIRPPQRGYLNPILVDKKDIHYIHIKAWNEPINLPFGGISYFSSLTNRFKEVLDEAIDKLSYFAEQIEVSYETVYFTLPNGDDLGGEYDTCNSGKCIDESKKAIRKQIGKGKHIKENWYQNDGDHENIERCSICEMPLNDSLTWCIYELEYIESIEWSAENFKEQAFCIWVILISIPTHDCSIGEYEKHQGGEILEKALQKREDFFQRVLNLARAIIMTDLK